MMLALMSMQSPTTTLDLLRDSTPATFAILGLLAVFSIASWIIIFWKWGQFRRLRREGALFLESMERTQRLEDAYKSVLRLPESPYTRLFRQGINFFSELRPGALRENAGPTPGLSEAQLSALRLVLEKEQDVERDELSAGLHWLAIIGNVSPLLGLMGTVVGVMNSFLGIAATGSSNISAVAPGVAEALVTTVAGLAVAIPSVIAYNYFMSRLGFFSGELEGFASEFIGTLAREGRL
ncbi:MAG TPA: MotA/TolQ/ExbB proton channel family protein [Longimicrobiales bacterium]|nr:MotA/TolQ/ExbB proton channel family protein [Longimicrobiales bacterium]